MEPLLLYSLGLITFIIILLVYSSKLPNKSYISRLIDRFKIIEGYIIMSGVIITFLVYKEQNRILKIDTRLNSINKGWVIVNELLVKYSDKCPNFIDTLYFEWQKDVIKSDLKKNKIDEWPAINYICVAIFQGIEDYLVASQKNPSGINLWLNIFITWCQSKTLRNFWEVSKLSYTYKTQHFIDLLINISNKYPHNNNSDCKKIVDAILNNEEYKKIMMMDM